jgi:drug/metabolite transporter (DMT)-like permease
MCPAADFFGNDPFTFPGEPPPRMQAPANYGRLGGIAMMCAAVALFGCLDATTKYLTSSLPLGEIVWARYASHLLLMVVVLGPTMKLDLVRTERLGIQVVRSLLLLACTVLFLTALLHLPLAEASAIAFVTPLMVTALSVPLLKERVGPRRWAAIGIGFLGVLLVVRPGGSVFHWAAALPVAMAFCYSLYQILTRLVSGSENPYMMLFYTGLIGTALTSLLLPFVWVTPATWFEIALLASAGVYGAVGHFLLIKALQRTPAPVLAPFAYSQIVWSGLLGWLVFGQFPDAVALLGMAIIVAAGLYVWWRDLTLARRTSNAAAASRIESLSSP